jgi:hypothetical protein
MATYNEKQYVGDWLKWEEDNGYSREEVTFVSGQNIKSGHVVGKITVGGKYAEYNNAAGTGVEAAAGIALLDVDASAADKKGVIIVRQAIINPNELTWKSDQDAAAKTAGLVDLAALGIVARTGA